MPLPSSRNRVLLKFMDEQYVDSFINEGLLFMNNVQFFREYEDEDPALRGDSYEGLAASWLPSEVVLTINGREITDAVGKIDLRDNHQDETNIYSMAIISDQDILDAGPEGLFLSKRFKGFGNKTVIISGKNITEFWRRVQEALDSSVVIYNFGADSVVARKVTYVERSDHHNQLDIFNKFSEFKWQYEWRLALKQADKGALSLYIGCLSDIASVADTESLINSPIKFVPKDL
ncbi:hypothetical protein TUM4438_43870 [Shewanella sairae]|uniref:Uncharacterized protein n=1 Tax=Shewanella sairae TaxID=190310 RepID=A0ABQ4PRI6_9GAMM|nr:hypothetical protein [Shewanella sairae]MCL1132302.1 hypothetical protein [Shewanella sairae]GIU52089.1 hypothetical protein TUM4438_43870 [Shewanella sairae]